jgi:paraquat-inducible protein A
MIDIFVLVLLVTSVHFGGLSVIDVAPAAFAFGMSVIFTMLATNSFDTRLMWDMKREIEDIDETEEIDNMK